MLYFKNKDDNKNVGKLSGKKFVVEFEVKSYVLREDGSRELVNVDAAMHLLTFLKDVDRELIMFTCKPEKF